MRLGCTRHRRPSWRASTRPSRTAQRRSSSCSISTGCSRYPKDTERFGQCMRAFIGRVGRRTDGRKDVLHTWTVRPYASSFHIQRYSTLLSHYLIFFSSFPLDYSSGSSRSSSPFPPLGSVQCGYRCWIYSPPFVLQYSPPTCAYSPCPSPTTPLMHVLRIPVVRHPPSLHIDDFFFHVVPLSHLLYISRPSRAHIPLIWYLRTVTLSPGVWCPYITLSIAIEIPPLTPHACCFIMLLNLFCTYIPSRSVLSCISTQ